MGKAFFSCFLVSQSFRLSSATVTFVTVAILQHFLGHMVSASVWAAVVMAVCVMLLMRGQYRQLDWAIKPIMAVLVVTTLVALAAALFSEPIRTPDFVLPSPWILGSIAFLVALMGWTPAPIEVLSSRRFGYSRMVYSQSGG